MQARAHRKDARRSHDPRTRTPRERRLPDDLVPVRDCEAERCTHGRIEQCACSAEGDSMTEKKVDAVLKLFDPEKFDEGFKKLPLEIQEKTLELHRVAGRAKRAT